MYIFIRYYYIYIYISYTYLYIYQSLMFPLNFKGRAARPKVLGRSASSARALSPLNRPWFFVGKMVFSPTTNRTHGVFTNKK